MRGRLCQIIYLTAFLQISLTPILSAQKPSSAMRWDVPLQKCWESGFEESDRRQMSEDRRQTIFLPLADGKLQALEVSAGKTLWRSSFGGEIVSRPLFQNNKIYLVNKITAEGRQLFVLRALSSFTGLTLWERSLTLNFGKAADQIYLSAANNLLLLVSGAGQIIAFEPSGEREIWSRNLNVGITTEPLLFENKIFIGRADKKVSVLSAVNGADISEINLRQTPTGNSVVLNAGAIVAAGDRSGNLYAFRLTDFKILWRARVGAQVSELSSLADDLLVSSFDGFVYRLDSETGDYVWKKRLPARPLGQVLLSEEFILLTSIDGQTAPVLETETGKIVNQIQFDEGVLPVGHGFFIANKIVLSTNKGLRAYSPNCSAQ